MEARDSVLRAKHLSEASQHLPGSTYYRVLGWIHRILKPANYVEIGVHAGLSLAQTLPGTACIGIDPVLDIDPDLEARLAAARLYDLTSDAFFARYDLRELLGGPVELAFIDGLHVFEQVLRDFVNLEKYASSDTVILLHDCLPLDAATASRERTTDFYSGDVWKAALALRRLRPELEMVTVRTAPTGLCIVRGLDSGNRRFEEKLPEIVESYRELDFDYYLAHKQEMPEEIASDAETIWKRLGPRAAGQGSKDGATPAQPRGTPGAGRARALDYAVEQLGVASFASVEIGRAFGQYAFYMIDKPQVTRGFLLDAVGTLPGDQLLSAIEYCAERPGMRMLDGIFWDPQTISEIGSVDAVVLYDVLMRLVDPDWDRVLELYAPVTSSFVICNPQWEGGEQTTRLIDLGRADYLEAVPPWPGTDDLFDHLDLWDSTHHRRYRDGSHVFQWGITDADLEAKADKLGFSLDREWTLGPFPETKGFITKTFVFRRT